MKRFWLFVNGGLMLGLAAQVFADDKVDFGKQIQPIFASSCYKCHAGTKHKGDLKLDTVEDIRKGGKDAKDKVLVAGKPDKSDIYRRITLPQDDDDAMPPEGKADPLTKEQIALVKTWIEQGGDFGSWKSADKGSASAETKPDAAATADEGPKEMALPTVAAADPGALDKLRAAGALALPLAQNTNLLAVEFTSNANQIGDEQIALLAPMAGQIFDLNLANTKVTDSGLANLEGMKNLHRLHLEKTAISDAGLSHLKNLSTLEYLNLYSTPVTDVGVADLSNLKALKNLYLWQSKVTDGGADTLKKAIPGVAVDLGWKEPATADAAAK